MLHACAATWPSQNPHRNSPLDRLNSLGRTCDKAGSSTLGVDVWDGPGGGLVVTDITVNRGDTVRVRADGQIWSGVFGAGTNGREGWPGWAPDNAAPMQENGVVNALIMRFGNGGWIHAGGFWEGSVPSGETGGLLQLYDNDNKPHNGDAGRKWSVRVDVLRAGAAAVGIYV